MWRVGELFGGKLFRALGAGEHYADYADTIGGRHPGLRTQNLQKFLKLTLGNFNAINRFNLKT